MSPSGVSPAGPGHEKLQVPIGELLRSLAAELATAQQALDSSSLAAAEWMNGRRLFGNNPSEKAILGSGVTFPDGRDAQGRRTVRDLSWLELGFVPTFYRFVETLIEVRLTLRLEPGRDGQLQANTVTVGAEYASSYGFSAEMSSVIKTRFVPVPAPVGLERMQSSSSR